MLVVGERIRIPRGELVLRYSRSSGPGGQNVNKVETRVTLRWNAAASPSLDEGVRGRFLSRFASRITSGGEILITSQRFRERERNAAACLERLAQMLRDVEFPPRKRRATRPTGGSRERRLREKRARAETKRGRRPARSDEGR